MTRLRNQVGAAIATLAVCMAAHAAPDAAEINRLLQAGRSSEALQQVEQTLSSNPKDAQMRFFKGVILSEQGKNADAIAVFTALTKDHPELPEPYNNLAVLYGKQGQYDHARRALEAAIRTNPSYSTAYENLGDVYAKLASQAYSKALQINGSNTAVPPKLALIRDLFSARGTQVAAVAPRPTTTAAAPTAPVPTPAAKPPAAAPAPAAATPVPAAPAATQAATRQEVEAAVQAWADAWARRDLNDYYAAYTRNFSGASRSRKAWEDERRVRILGKRTITVGISDLQVDVRGDVATASFRQDYRADTFKSLSRKTLELVRSNGRWLIQKESTGS